MSWIILKKDREGRCLYHSTLFHSFVPNIEAAARYKSPPVKALLKKKRNPLLEEKYKNVRLIRIEDE